MSKEKIPKFFFEFDSFAVFDNRVETTFVVTPEWEINVLEETYHGEGKVKVLHLIFRKAEPQSGRRVYSLKKEFEQSSTGEITLDSTVVDNSVTKHE